MTLLSWEDAVRWYRAQPGNEAAIRDNYFDLPVQQAAERYEQGEEFREVSRILGPGEGRALLDLGAGNGLASFALARQGWQVTALEPDPSQEVGAGAIQTLIDATGLPIALAQEWGEKMPFEDATFHVVHARQVLHHAHDLEAMLGEVARVLRGGGYLLATREHVADDAGQLAAFRAHHPLHSLYGGENAFSLSRYQAAAAQAGLQLLSLWGPLESILNFHPGSETERQKAVQAIAKQRWRGLGRLLAWSRQFSAAQAKHADRWDMTPGRMYSFLWQKP